MLMFQECVCVLMFEECVCVDVSGICVRGCFRKCPLCRVQSDFITPSKLWVETEEEKKALIDGYKNALKSVSVDEAIYKNFLKSVSVFYKCAHELWNSCRPDMTFTVDWENQLCIYLRNSVKAKSRNQFLIA